MKRRKAESGRSFGSWERNERLVLFCNLLSFLVWYSAEPPSGSSRMSDIGAWNKTDYIMCTTRWSSPVRRVTAMPGVHCEMNRKLLKLAIGV